MRSDEHNGSFVQCQYCGDIYYIDRDIPVDAFIVKSICPNCGYKKALNCGKDREDIYLYMNESLDSRYYTY